MCIRYWVFFLCYPSSQICPSLGLHFLTCGECFITVGYSSCKSHKYLILMEQPLAIDICIQLWLYFVKTNKINLVIETWSIREITVIEMK